jgi:nucleoside-diphosphate-sugar epimerase
LPIVPVVGAGGNVLPVVYAGNVAAALVACLDRPATAPVRLFDLGVDHPITQMGLLEGLGHALGLRPRILHVPAGVVRRAAELGERLGLGIPGGGDLSLARFTRLTLEDNPYLSRRIRADLGFEPPFEHRVGLTRAALWLSDRARGRRAA